MVATRLGKCEPPQTFGHIAVRLEHCILVTGGDGIDGERKSHRLIWLYNLFTEQWTEHTIGTQESPQAPRATAHACAVGIGDGVYMFGRNIVGETACTNALWKLRASNGSVAWHLITVTSNTEAPSPRFYHNGWEYAEKLWIFGGFGTPMDGFLNKHGDFEMHNIAKYAGFGLNNQLLCFNTLCDEWTNPECFGSIPAPRACHALTVSQDKVWLYGGHAPTSALDDLYELSMHSLTWTQIQTTQPKPNGRECPSLNAVSSDKLVLHGGWTPHVGELNDTWIFDIQSKT